jgi:Na+/proline symporter
MDERLRIILIIIVSVSIFGLLVFVYVRNYIKTRLEYFLKKKNYKKLTIRR